MFLLRQRIIIRPVIGRRPGFRPTFHKHGVNNNNIIHENCQRMDSGVRVLLNCTKPRNHTRQWTDYASTGCSDSKVLLSPDTQHWTDPVKDASTTRMRCYTAFRRQRCSVCNVCKTALPGSSAVLKNTTTSRQYCSICTGYRFECARHIKCFYFIIP